MVFSSNFFLFCFLPIVLAIYHLLKEKYKNVFLLLASLFFYFWGEEKSIVIIVTSILINYIMGLFIYYIKWDNLKKIGLILAIALNIGLLFYYKYYDFFITSINDIVGTNITIRNVALPIGISFFTFSGVSYVVDLYRRKVPAQKNIIKVALYISFFSKLTAGPIVRYIDIADQIDKRKETIEKFVEGICRFVGGLAKKIILANGVGIIADEIFNAPYSQHSISTVWLGIICYTLQIYFDFSGYSDMAIGLGKMFGFDFLENFNLPYISSSIKEFWRRWHISLSSFFRDYVYIPLGGSRKGNVYFNLLVVFFLTGLWHGESWNFIAWGLWHGFFVVIERLNTAHQLIKIKLPKLLQHIGTILIVMIGWVMFRADTLQYAIGYIGRMFGINKADHIYFQTGYYLDAYRIFVIILSIIASIGLFAHINKKLMENKYYTFIRNIFTILIFFLCIIYVMNTTYNPFIYFRF